MKNLSVNVFNSNSTNEHSLPKNDCWCLCGLKSCLNADGLVWEVAYFKAFEKKFELPNLDDYEDIDITKHVVLWSELPRQIGELL